MKMKHIIPAVLFASASLTAGAQAQLTSGIDLKNLDNMSDQLMISISTHVADG